MLQLPPMPSWDAMHPLLIHFPIVLLLISPLFIAIAAAIRPPKNRPYMTSALITLALGTAGLFLAASSGEEAAEFADRSGAVNAVLATHEHLASTSEIVFTTLLTLFVGIYLCPIVSRRPQTRLSSSTAPLVFLAAYLVGLVCLVNTAHAGGRLVHEYGVHAMMPQESAPASQHPSPAAPERGEGD